MDSDRPKTSTIFFAKIESVKLVSQPAKMAGRKRCTREVSNSKRLVTSIISPPGGRGVPDCSVSFVFSNVGFPSLQNLLNSSPGV